MPSLGRLPVVILWCATAEIKFKWKSQLCFGLGEFLFITNVWKRWKMYGVFTLTGDKCSMHELVIASKWHWWYIMNKGKLLNKTVGHQTMFFRRGGKNNEAQWNKHRCSGMGKREWQPLFAWEHFDKMSCALFNHQCNSEHNCFCVWLETSLSGVFI